MIDDLNRPLGVKTKKTTRQETNWGLAVAIFGFLAIGVGGYYFGYFQNTDNSKIARTKEASTEEPKNPQQENSGFKKRPDLPIENEAGGLRELSPDDNRYPAVSIPKPRPENVRQDIALAYLPDPELIEQSEFGLLPRRSPDGLRPIDVYSRQPDTEGNFGVARVVIIVGGLGISQTSTQQAIRVLPANVTLAFAPYGNSLSRWMQTARKGGHELLLQIPMEPFGYPQITAGEHTLLTSTNQQKTIKELQWNLAKITNYVGIMNHLGGKMLTTPDKFLPVLNEIENRGLLFVDSGDIKNSTAEKIAKKQRLPFARAHISLDSIRASRNIKKRLVELETLAKRTGLAIGVATAFPDSIAAISQFLKNAKARGLELTPISAVVSKPKE